MPAASLDALRARLDLLRALDAATHQQRSYDFAPPLSEEAIAAHEAQHSITLPDEYRAYLQHLGDGQAGPYAGLYPLEHALKPIPGPRAPGASSSAALARPFPLVEPYHPRSPKDALPLPPGAHLYDGCLRLTDLGSGGVIVLIVTGPRRGEIWRDESAQRGPFTQLSPSFFAWLHEWTRARLHAESLHAGQHHYGSTPDDETRALLERLPPLLDEPDTHARLALAWVLLCLGDTARAASLEEELSAHALPSRVLREERDELTLGLYREPLAQSQNPDAAPEVLDALARHPAPRVRRSVALHPKLSHEAQALLAQDAWTVTEILAANQALSEDAGAALIRRATTAEESADAAPQRALTLEALSARETLSGENRAALWSFGQANEGYPGDLVRRTLALRADLTSEEAAQLSRDPSAWVRHGVALNPRTPAEVLAELVDDLSGEVLRGLAENPGLSEAAQLRLTRDPTEGVSEVLAAHSASRSVREKLSREGLPWMLAALAQNPHLSPEELNTLAYYPSRTVRTRLAHHPSAPASALRVLLVSDEGGLRPHIASNPNLDEYALEELCNDGSHGVREGLAQNPALSEAQLTRFGLHPARELQLANCPSLSLSAREALLQHEEEMVREAAQEALLFHQSPRSTQHARLAADYLRRRPYETRPAFWSRWPEAPAARVLRADVVWHPSYPPALLERALHDAEHLADAAQSPWISAEQLATAATQDAGALGAASHPDTPKETLRALASHPREQVRAEVARNPSTPFAVREALADDASPTVRKGAAACRTTSVMFAVRFFSDDNQEVRAQVATHPGLTADLLSRLGRDRIASVRARVALHPETPRSTLQQLSLDIEASVRDAAQWRLQRGNT